MIERQKIVIFGEILYDCFPDGRKIPGGAPFNVAWNLQAFEKLPFFLSAVGADDMGGSLKELAFAWGMDIHGIQNTNNHPTSTVEVIFEQGSPTYAIIDDTAMDHLRLPAILNYQPKSLLYHGSLAVRGEKSMKTLREIRERWKGKVFVDVNIRNPWFSLERFSPLLKGVDYLKLNDEEYEQITGEALELSQLEHQLRILSSKYEISDILLTCGKQGAYWLTSDGELHHVEALGGNDIVDTVGAGDAFASICLVGISSGWSPEKTLKEASLFAGKVCTLRGATTKDKGFYSLS